MKKNSRIAEKNASGDMPLSGHLRELRNRLLICFAALVAGMLICMYLAGDIVRMMIDMGARYGYRYVYIAPQEMLMAHVSVAVAGAVILSVPIIAHQAYCFALPGLEKKEQRTVLFSLLFGLLCFLAGVLFAWKISLPFMLYFLINFGKNLNVAASVSIREYIGFLTTVLLIFGIVFELPVISALLTSLGILKSSWMAKGRKFMIVVIFLIAAVITPPDIISQIMVGIPMCLLYEISIRISKLFEKKRNGNTEQEE